MLCSKILTVKYILFKSFLYIKEHLQSRYIACLLHSTSNTTIKHGFFCVAELGKKGKFLFLMTPSNMKYGRMLKIIA